MYLWTTPCLPNTKPTTPHDSRPHTQLLFQLLWFPCKANSFIPVHQRTLFLKFFSLFWNILPGISLTFPTPTSNSTLTPCLPHHKPSSLSTFTKLEALSTQLHLLFSARIPLRSCALSGDGALRAAMGRG